AGLILLTGGTPGDKAQWVAYGLGAYAVFSWTQSLRRRDLPSFRLIWGCPTVIMLTAAIGSIAFITYAVAFWTPPYALRTFYAGPGDPARILHGVTAREEVSALVGWSAAVAAAAGVIIGGIVADWWRRRDPRGRLLVCMASVVLPVPAVAVMFTTKD